MSRPEGGAARPPPSFCCECRTATGARRGSGRRSTRARARCLDVSSGVDHRGARLCTATATCPGSSAARGSDRPAPRRAPRRRSASTSGEKTVAHGVERSDGLHGAEPSVGVLIVSDGGATGGSPRVLPFTRGLGSRFRVVGCSGLLAGFLSEETRGPNVRKLGVFSGRAGFCGFPLVPQEQEPLFTDSTATDTRPRSASPRAGHRAAPEKNPANTRRTPRRPNTAVGMHASATGLPRPAEPAAPEEPARSEEARDPTRTSRVALIPPLGEDQRHRV